MRGSVAGTEHRLIGQQAQLRAAARVDVSRRARGTCHSGWLHCDIPLPKRPSACCQSGVASLQSVSIAAHLAEQLLALGKFVRAIDRRLRFVIVVQEREQPVVLRLRERIVLVVVALGALNRQPQHALADGVHAVEHGFHAKLLGIDAPFFVEHRVAQESRWPRSDPAWRREAGRRRSAR